MESKVVTGVHSALFATVCAAIGFLVWLASMKMRSKRLAQRSALQRSALASPLDLLRDASLPPPDWLLRPDVERCQWLNMLVHSCWPGLQNLVAERMASSLSRNLAAHPLSIPGLEHTQLLVEPKEVVAGSAPPCIEAVKAHRVSEDRLLLDVSFTWMSSCAVKLQLATGPTEGAAQSSGSAGGHHDAHANHHGGGLASSLLHGQHLPLVTLRDAEVKGCLRLDLGPIVTVFPYVSSYGVSLLSMPVIDFDLSAPLNVMSLPGVNAAITDTLRRKLCEALLFPRAMRFDLLPPETPEVAGAVRRANEARERVLSHGLRAMRDGPQGGHIARESEGQHRGERQQPPRAGRGGSRHQRRHPRQPMADAIVQTEDQDGQPGAAVPGATSDEEVQATARLRSAGAGALGASAHDAISQTSSGSPQRVAALPALAAAAASDESPPSPIDAQNAILLSVPGLMRQLSDSHARSLTELVARQHGGTASTGDSAADGHHPAVVERAIARPSVASPEPRTPPPAIHAAATTTAAAASGSSLPAAGRDKGSGGSRYEAGDSADSSPIASQTAVWLSTFAPTGMPLPGRHGRGGSRGPLERPISLPSAPTSAAARGSAAETAATPAQGVATATAPPSAAAGGAPMGGALKGGSRGDGGDGGEEAGVDAAGPVRLLDEVTLAAAPRADARVMAAPEPRLSPPTPPALDGLAAPWRPGRPPRAASGPRTATPASAAGLPPSSSLPQQMMALTPMRVQVLRHWADAPLTTSLLMGASELTGSGSGNSEPVSVSPLRISCERSGSAFRNHPLTIIPAARVLPYEPSPASTSSEVAEIAALLVRGGGDDDDDEDGRYTDVTDEGGAGGRAAPAPRPISPVYETLARADAGANEGDQGGTEDGGSAEASRAADTASGHNNAVSELADYAGPALALPLIAEPVSSPSLPGWPPPQQQQRGSGDSRGGMDHPHWHSGLKGALEAVERECETVARAPVVLDAGTRADSYAR